MAKYYWIEIRHPGLNKYKIIKAPSKRELEQKKDVVLSQWNEQWKKKLEREQHASEAAAKKAAREAQLISDEESTRYAEEQTNEAEELQQELNSILSDNLNVAAPFDFGALKDFSKFTELSPVDIVLTPVPVEPKITDPKYNPKPGLFTKLSKKKLSVFEENVKSVFSHDHATWEDAKKKIDDKNNERLLLNQQAKQSWQQRKDAFLQMQQKHNDEIDLYRMNCKIGNPDSVARYFTTILDDLEFPIEFPHNVEVEYKPENRVLIVEYQLPTIADIPSRKAVKYVKKTKEFKESFYTESYIKSMYDSVIYQIVLVLLNVIFADVDDYPSIEIATINGIIETTDRSTGKTINPCILSISVDKTSFKDLNLEAIDAKAWFKKAKGISASSLSFQTPVAPVMSFSREDKRFIEGYNVVDELESGVNLAAIDWQDFENLIRELFEKEFSTNGGEVRITQASRDGGVDAVAFDPDPIRGGKIVIQAKRYTNVVGVSAVRDLYGTVVHEGAIKGILITTSFYGKDAYEFAKEKPISLMDGGNLLALMQKHGYNARIDLEEAKKLLK